MNHEDVRQPRGVRARIKRGDGAVFRAIRASYYALNRAQLPLPKSLCKVIWNAYRVTVTVYYWMKSTFLVAPLFRGLCEEIGTNFRAGTFAPFVSGQGKVFLGNGVRFYGKQNFLFASIKSELPTIHVGDGTGFGHSVTFDIAGRMQIGKGCMVASGVMFVDCGGHSIVPELRAAGIPPKESDVRDIVIGDNVWIGTGAFILPGAAIGDNCVIAPNTVVTKRIPPNSLVYAVAPKVMEIRDISKMM